MKSALPTMFVLLLVFAISTHAFNTVDLNDAILDRSNPDGSKEYTLKSGARAIIWPDGRTRQFMPDGTVISSWPANGRNEVWRVEKPGGSVESHFANGTKKTVYHDGLVTWVFPDGMVREERLDGSVWESISVRRDLVDPSVVRMNQWKPRVDRDEKIIFSGELMPGYGSPWACVLLPNGEVLDVPAGAIKQGPRNFEFAIDTKGMPGMYRVELIVGGKLGNMVAFNLTVWAGVEPDGDGDRTRLYRTIEPLKQLHELEGQFFKIVNREREKRNISKVAWDLECAQLARNMAREMVDENYFGHVSPRNGNLAHRAAKIFKWNRIAYGLPPVKSGDDMPNFIADDIVRARSIEGAMAILLESPAHRRVILCESWTNAGIGICRVKGGDRREVIIVAAMLRLNRPKRYPPQPVEPEQPEGMKIYGRP